MIEHGTRHESGLITLVHNIGELGPQIETPKTERSNASQNQDGTTYGSIETAMACLVRGFLDVSSPLTGTDKFNSAVFIN